MWVPIASGLAVGAAVSAAARLLGVASCGPVDPAPLALGGDCPTLVASMAIRMGVAVGVTTAVVVLLAAGLVRTVARIEEDRRVRRLERLSGRGP